MKKYVYVAYSKDKYKLPVFVADSVKELSIVMGISENTISSVISHGKKQGKEFRFARVDVSGV
jgi:hypothetical protein|nr:MAG TPA: Protein of unknown function (DUF1580) [Bacteriophage sp.]